MKRCVNNIYISIIRKRQFYNFIYKYIVDCLTNKFNYSGFFGFFKCNLFDFCNILSYLFNQ